MFRTLSGIDVNLTHMDQALNVLSVFSECLDSEVNGYNPDEPWTAVCTCERLPRIVSVLEAARRDLQNCYEGLRKDVEKGVEIYRSEIPEREKAEGMQNNE